MNRYTYPDLKDVPLAAVMQALSDPIRLSIIHALVAAGTRELAPREIPLKISKATRSHHFSILRDAGLILTRPEGTSCMTSLRTAELNRRFPGLIPMLLADGKGKKVKRAKGQRR